MILLLLFFSIIDNNNAVRVQSASSSSSSLSLTSSPIQDQNNDLSNAITHAVTPLSDKEKALLLAKPVYECEGCPSKDANMKDGSSGAVNLSVQVTDTSATATFVVKELPRQQK